MTDKEAFEEWFVAGRDESGLESVDKKDGENIYVYSDTKMAWAAWQAAIKSMQASMSYGKVCSDIDPDKKDAERYRWLRITSMRLDLPNSTIAGLVRDKSEIDAAMKDAS